MTQTLPVPAPTASPAPVVSSAVPSPQEVVVRRLALRGIPWSLYEQLLAVVGDGLPRMTYDRGMLEMETLSERHEALKWMAGRFVEAYAEESGIRYKATGSTTWRREAIEGGLEADESYYIQNHGRVRGREIDLETDPPPDLAIEIDLSAPDVEKANVYARLGVPEIWQWRNGRLTVLARQPGGHYTEHPQSIALLEFPLGELADALGRYPQMEPDEAVVEFRRRVREKRAGVDTERSLPFQTPSGREPKTYLCVAFASLRVAPHNWFDKS